MAVTRGLLALPRPGKWWPAVSGRGSGLALLPAARAPAGHRRARTAGGRERGARGQVRLARRSGTIEIVLPSSLLARGSMERAGGPRQPATTFLRDRLPWQSPSIARADSPSRVSSGTHALILSRRFPQPRAASCPHGTSCSSSCFPAPLRRPGRGDLPLQGPAGLRVMRLSCGASASAARSSQTRPAVAPLAGRPPLPLSRSPAPRAPRAASSSSRPWAPPGAGQRAPPDCRPGR